MNDVPVWVIYAAGTFFVLGTIFFAALVVMLAVIIKLLVGLRPRLEALEASVQGLVQKIQIVTERVEEVATSIKATVDIVGVRAKGVAGTAEMVAQTAGRQFEKHSPILVAAMTTIKIIGAIRDARESRRIKEEAKAKKAAYQRKSLLIRLIDRFV